MTSPTAHPHDLVLTRLIDAPAATLYRCWTDTALLQQWFVPRPWTIAWAEMRRYLEARVRGEDTEQAAVRKLAR